MIFQYKAINSKTDQWAFGDILIPMKDISYLGTSVAFVCSPESDGGMADILSIEGGSPVCSIKTETICACSGVTDQDGTLIYENDIVQDGKAQGIIRFGEYGYQHIGFYIEWQGQASGYCPYLKHWAPWLQVVGNIHSPEASAQ